MQTIPQLDMSVRYVPDKCHMSRMSLNTGKYPWIVGRKVLVLDKKGRTQEVVEEMDDSTFANYLREVRNHPTPDVEMSKLILIRHAETWSATVTAVNEDGTVSLDIVSGTPGVILHCDNVPYDPLGEKPHTYHIV